MIKFGLLKLKVYLTYLYSMKILITEEKIDRVIKSYIRKNLGKFYEVKENYPNQYYHLIGNFYKNPNDERASAKMAIGEGKVIIAIDKDMYMSAADLFSMEAYGAKLDRYFEEVGEELSGIKINLLVTF